MSILFLYAFLAGLSPLSASSIAWDAGREATDSVKIGLLITDSSQSEVIMAARLAIKEANQKDGFWGQPFSLVIRSAEGPWGAGSKASVGLVYENDVKAIVGSLDGRNAHLAEQVAAKSHITYVETRATDPTLSQAFVPWFYRLVPNDDQQSKAILRLITERGPGKIAILATGDDATRQYDTGHAVKSLSRVTERIGDAPPLVLTLEPDGANRSELINQISSVHITHLIIPFYSEDAMTLAEQSGNRQPELKIYGSLEFASGLFHSGDDLRRINKMVLVHSFGISPDRSQEDPERVKFDYTYDGITVVTNAIRRSGADRESIIKAMVRTHHPDGLTGPVSFDGMGNRTGALRFIQIIDGKVVPFP